MAHFDSFRRYLSELQARNLIESFEMVMLDGRPGHLNGFFLIQGDRDKLSELTQSDDWLDHMERAVGHLETGCVRDLVEMQGPLDDRGALGILPGHDLHCER